MIRIVLISTHRAEAEILQSAFRMYGMAVFTSEPSAGNYLQILQFKPDFVFMEIPVSYADSLASLKMLRHNEKLREVPVTCFGDQIDPNVIDQFHLSGGAHFIRRPLKIQVLLDEINKHYPDQNIGETASSDSSSDEDEQNDNISVLLDPKESRSRKIQTLLDRVGKQLSCPFAIAKIAEITNSHDTGADDLAKAINSDQGICTTILKVANSVHFASRNQIIANVRDAIVRLGFVEVRNIALGLAVMEMGGEKREDSFGFDRQEYWTHCLVRGLIAEKLARYRRLPNTSLAFLGGFLADYTLLLLDMFCEPLLTQIIQTTAQKGCAVEDSFEELLNLRLTEIECSLFEKWRFPAGLIQSLDMLPRFFDRPEEQHPDDIRTLTTCIAFAEVLSRAADLGRGVDCYIKVIPDAFFREMGLLAGISPTFFDTIHRDIQVYARFLGLEVPSPNWVTESDVKGLYIRIGQRIFSAHYMFLSKNIQISQVRSLDAAQEKLEQESFQVIFIEHIPGLSKEEMEQLVEMLQTKGKSIPVLGLCSDEIHEEMAEKLQGRCIPQHSDLRQLAQLTETLLNG